MKAQGLAARKPWRTARNLAVADHNVPTTDRSVGIADPVSRLQVDQLFAGVQNGYQLRIDLDAQTALSLQQTDKKSL